MNLDGINWLVVSDSELLLLDDVSLLSAMLFQPGLDKGIDGRTIVHPFL